MWSGPDVSFVQFSRITFATGEPLLVNVMDGVFLTVPDKRINSLTVSGFIVWAYVIKMSSFGIVVVSTRIIVPPPMSARSRVAFSAFRVTAGT